MKKFLFGKIYNVINSEENYDIENLDDNKEKNVITEEEENEIIQGKNPWEINKNTYINETYELDNSKIIIWNVYIANVLYMEKILSKDLYNFSVSELDQLLSSIPSSRYNYRSQVAGFCEQYLNWCIGKGIITVNNIKAIDRGKITKISRKSARKRFVSLKDFYGKIYEFSINSDPQELIGLVLARYIPTGIDYELLLNVRIGDINRITNTISLYTNEKKLYTILPIDREFIKWCEKADEEADINDKYNENVKLIKSTRVTDAGLNAVYNRMNDVFDRNNFSGWKMNDLTNSRKIEFLLQIRKERKITTTDVQNIVKAFKPEASVGAYNSLVKYYEALTGDVVMPARTKKEDLIDEDSEKIVAEIEKNLNM